MNRKVFQYAVVTTLVLMALGVFPASAAPVKPDRPLPVYLVATDGQRLVGEIIAFDDQGFELKDATGATQKVAWEKLSAKTVYQLHEKLLNPRNADDKAAWAELAQRLTKMKDGGEWAAKAQQRAGGQAPSPSSPQPAPPQPAPKSDTPQPAAAPVAPGQWTDLLALADLDLDGVEGQWARQGDGLLAPDVRLGRLALPAMPEGDYEFEVEFERIGGKESAAVLFPVGKTQLALSLGWSDGGKNGLDSVDGKTLLSEKTGQVVNNKRHRLLVRVTVKGDNADIDTNLDGQTLIKWSGPLKKLKTPDGWKLPSPGGVGLGSQKSKVVFHSARIRMLSGELKLVPRETRLAQASVPKLPKEAGDFVTSLAVDKQNNLWVGTEGKGLWRYDPSAPLKDRWKQFTRVSTGGDDESYGPSMTYGTKNQSALGDDFAYAMAVDDLGRLWVGHLNHGVSVYNGKEWRNYDRITGPLGERIFDIEVAPPLAGQKYGDIWMASSLGLARYSPTTEKWSYRTRAEGLPEDQVQALAFDKQGRMYAGTQCHGMAIGDPSDDYMTWKNVTGPDPFSNKPSGEGLPTNLINDVLVAKDGTVYVATSHGLAKSKDRGKNWSFIRGRDWEAMVNGRDSGAKPSGAMTSSGLLAEDYITSLAEDNDGNIWIGYRQMGCEAYEFSTGKRIYASPPARSGLFCFKLFTAKILSCPLYSIYGGGLHSVPQAQLDSRSELEDGSSAPVPHDAAIIPIDQIAAQFHISDATGNARAGEMPSGSATEISTWSEDWSTQGDWLGRYGRYWACLCAICAPHDYFWGAGDSSISFHGRIGHNHKNGDSLRRWVWSKYSDDRRVLELPPVYLQSRIAKGYTTESRGRRPAGWDDHAEVYPQSLDGPHMYFSLTVPEGIFRLSLYFHNHDGDSGRNRFRDYLVSIRENPPKVIFLNPNQFADLPELSRSRVRDFRNGVYKQLVVKGPANLTIQISRNNSFNTMLSGIFLDTLDELPAPYRDPSHQQAATERPSQGDDDLAIRPLERFGAIAFATIDTGRTRFLYSALLRWLDSHPEDTKRYLREMATCCYQLGLYADWEHNIEAAGFRSPRSIEKSLKWDGQSSYSGKGREAIARQR